MESVKSLEEENFLEKLFFNEMSISKETLRSREKGIRTYARKNDIYGIKLLSEKNDATVGVGNLNNKQVYLKSFSNKLTFESELSGLFLLRGANVPEIVDVCNENLLILMNPISGKAIDSKNAHLVFEFLAQAHHIGMKNIEEDGIESSPIEEAFNIVYKLCASHGIGAKHFFCIGDHNPTNYLHQESDLISRLDFGTFSLGYPPECDLVFALWHLHDVFDYEINPNQLSSSYYYRRKQIINDDPLKIKYWDNIDQFNQYLDLITRVLDPKTNTFYEHYGKIKSLKEGQRLT
jgi:hypothetical protein